MRYSQWIGTCLFTAPIIAFQFYFCPLCAELYLKVHTPYVWSPKPLLFIVDQTLRKSLLKTHCWKILELQYMAVYMNQDWERLQRERLFCCSCVINWPPLSVTVAFSVGPLRTNLYFVLYVHVSRIFTYVLYRHNRKWHKFILRLEVAMKVSFWIQIPELEERKRRKRWRRWKLQSYLFKCIELQCLSDVWILCVWYACGVWITFHKVESLHRNWVKLPVHFSNMLPSIVTVWYLVHYLKQKF